MRTRLTEMFKLEVPLFAFTRSREVVVEVSKAGGMGVLGAIAHTAKELADDLDWIDAHIGGRPYGVDVVMPASYAGSEQETEVGAALSKETFEEMLPQAHREFVTDLMLRYAVPPLPEGQAASESLLSWTYSKARPLVDIALSHPIKLLANALGPPPPDIIAKAHEHGVLVAALTGSVHHAQKQVEAGVDIIVAQGCEAGGHTGEIATMVLVPDIVDAVHPTPVLAAGGIGTGRQMAAALALGAEGVWTGSIWLTAAESNTPKVVREKLLKAGSADTVRSRAMTGKPARQLKTAWTQEWEAKTSPGTLPMPLQFMLTAEAVTRIHQAADNPNSRASELLGSAVGQIVGRMNVERPAGEIVRDMVAEAERVVRRLGDASKK